jgi:hypothetical protein
MAESPRTEQSLRSTASLDWTAALENRGELTIAQAREIAAAPLPSPEPCSERHFNQCLRVLLSALPKRNSDEVSGELLISAYERKLGGFCKDQISYLSDKALERCEWFPTIAECLGIIGEWKRIDAPLQIQERAKSMVMWDRQRRFDDVMIELACGRYSQDQIDAMPDSWKVVGETRGYLWAQDDGSYTARILPGGKRSRAPEAVQDVPTPAAADCRTCQDVGRVLDLAGNEVVCPDCGVEQAEAAE